MAWSGDDRNTLTEFPMFCEVLWERSGADDDFFLTYYTLAMWKRILDIGLIAHQSRITESNLSTCC